MNIKDMLCPCPEESVDEESTQNLYIEGDNLEVLKLLKKDYAGKVKMIYIDPPYNTGNEYVYHDHFHQTKDGQSDWCAMIYPRLMAASCLLQENGVIFLSIDHHELIRLTNICDEVFGPTNRVGILSIVNNLKGRSDGAFFATCNEFLLVYAKDKTALKLNGFALDDEELDKDYDKQDEIGYYKLIGFRKTGTAWRREERPYMYYPVFYKKGIFKTAGKEELEQIYSSERNAFDDAYADELTRKYEQAGYQVVWPIAENGDKGRWRWGVETFNQRKDLNLDFNSAGTLCTKMRATLEDGSIRVKTAKTLWYKPEYDTGSSARLLKRLFGKADIFENPKSLVLLKDILTVGSEKDSIILDFFSGSATTAHAVMQLNAEDGGRRKFIMIQWPQECDKSSKAYKAGYKNICEIGKERIRRAGKQIKEEAERRGQAIDVGFRVLKLGESVCTFRK